MLGRAVRIALVVGLALLLWATVVEPNRLVWKRVTIHVPASKDAPRRLLVAALADVHTGSPWLGLERLGRIVAAVNAQKPDLVVLLGDYVIHGVPGGHFVAPDETARILGRLQARLGVYAVLGNHDEWLDTGLVEKALEGAGIPVLVNTARLVPDGTQRFWVAGVADLWTGRPDIEGALRGVPPEAMVLLLTHNPDVFPRVPARVALTLAGHTHGGQVRLPLLGAPVVPSSFDQRYAAGLVRENGRQLFVTSGLGMSLLPVRFGVPPEVALLSLEAP
jgi:predicted MPP superfamily phosphohydrolase